MKLILASASPRRREILEKNGYAFTVRTAPTDETLPAGTLPKVGVRLLAERKGAAVAAMSSPDECILSSDTLVELDGVPLGKPRDAADAERMLRALSGRKHCVRTGIAVRIGDRMISDVATTDVYFKTLTDRDIADYVESGEPMDKAGAYGIQGRGGAFVEKIDGDFDTVMGLSVRLTEKLLADITGDPAFGKEKNI